MQRSALLLALSASIMTGCFQELNTGAANETSSSSTGPGAAPDACGPDQIVGSGGACLDFTTTTPAIDLGDGSTTDEPCERTMQRSMEIRQTYCGSCHGGGVGQAVAGFHTVLDDTMLVSTVSATAKDEAGMPLRMLIPGNPEGSRVYQRIALSQMPPAPSVGADPGPMPSIADLSVLRSWILCLKDAEQGGWGSPDATTTTTMPPPSSDAGGDGAPEKTNTDAGVIVDARADSRG